MHVTNTYVILFLASAKTGDTGIWKEPLKKKEPLHLNYILQRHNLEHVSSAKYPEVTITSDIKGSAHIQNISQKANNNRIVSSPTERHTQTRNDTEEVS